jgi:hypothetical protein
VAIEIVERLVIEGLANVLHAGRPRTDAVFYALGARIEQRAIDVDQVRELHLLHLGKGRNVRAPPAMNPRDADAHRVVGADHAARSPRSRNRKQRKNAAGGSSTQDGAAGEATHGGLLGERRAGEEWALNADDERITTQPGCFVQQKLESADDTSR